MMGALPGPPSTKHPLRQTCERVAWVVAQHWLVAITLFLPALFVASIAGAVTTASRMPVGVLQIGGYMCFELAAFCIERSWSQVSMLRFWRVAGPFCLLQILLVCLACPKRHACSFLLSGACLGCRVCTYYGVHAHPTDGQSRKNRLAIACIRGWFYSCALCLFVVAGFAVVRISLMRTEERSLVTLVLLFGLFLPVSRSLLRLLVVQCVSSAALLLDRCGGAWTANTSETGYGNAKPKSHPVDALVLLSDTLVSTATLLEVPYAFAQLLVPNALVFALCVLASAVLDALFLSAHDALRPVPWRSTAEGADWAPSFSIDRPAPFLAALSSRALFDAEPSETTCLTSEAPADSMSPRVSMLLDEFNRTLIGSRRAGVGPAGSGRRGGGVCTYIQQERKLAITTHAVAATVATVLAVVCVPVLGLSAKPSGVGFANRAAFLLALRTMADALTCWKSMRGAPSPDGGGATERASAEALWDGPRLEFASLRGWLSCALISCCSTFPVMVATSTGAR